MGIDRSLPGAVRRRDGEGKRRTWGVFGMTIKITSRKNLSTLPLAVKWSRFISICITRFLDQVEVFNVQGETLSPY